MKNIFKVGDRVQSHYKSKWSGTVTEIEKLKKTTSNKNKN